MLLGLVFVVLGCCERICKCRAVQKLRREVEKAKRTLSNQHQVRVEVESMFEGDDFSETLTRAKFEELNMVR